MVLLLHQSIKPIPFSPSSCIVKQVLHLALSPQGGTLAIAGKDKVVELFNVHSTQEISTRRRKRLARYRKKLEKHQQSGSTERMTLFVCVCVCVA
jgi:predicted ATP-grasp superfamily ATP-dependent carboligase